MYSYMEVYHLKLFWATATKYKQNKNSSVFINFTILIEAVRCVGKKSGEEKAMGSIYTVIVQHIFV